MIRSYLQNHLHYLRASFYELDAGQFEPGTC